MKTDLTDIAYLPIMRLAGQTDAGTAEVQPARDNRPGRRDSVRVENPSTHPWIELFQSPLCLKKPIVEGKKSNLNGKALCPIPAEPIHHELELMKQNAILVNVGRAALLDETALFEHLVNNPHFKAGIDAWWVEPFSACTFKMDHPFCKLPNFIGSPHNSAMVPGVIERAVELAALTVRNFIQENPIRGIVSREQYR